MSSRHLCGLAVAALFAVSSVAAATADVRLLEAAKNQDQATAVSLVKYSEGANVNATDAEGMTALLWAAHWDNLELARLLIAAGANVKAANRFGSTALHEAATFGDAALMEVLLKGGADANATRGEGDTPLLIAAGTGKTEAVELLLAHGAPVDVRDGWYGETPLMIAVANNYADVAQVLIAHGADVNATSTKFAEPEIRHRVMVDATTTINPPAGGLTPLHFAARQDAMDAAKVLIAAGANVNALEPDANFSPLLVAVYNNHYDVAALLIEKGANVNDNSLALIAIMRTDPEIQRPLPMNFRQDSLGVMKLLLDRGADANLPFTKKIGYHFVRVVRGATPFITAATSFDTPAMRLLIQPGVKPVPLRNGMNALMVMAQTNKDDGSSSDAQFDVAAKICLDAGIDINAATMDGNTALHYAAGAGNDHIVQYLVAHGANLDAKTSKGRTPLQWAQGLRPSAGGLGARLDEKELPRESTIALLQKLMGMGASASAQNVSSSQQ